MERYGSQQTPDLRPDPGAAGAPPLRPSPQGPKGRRVLVAISGALLAGLFAFPFAVASAPCGWRLNTYAHVGLGILAVLVVIPFVLPRGALVASRIGSALILAALCVVVWIAGMFAADVRILCRLF